MMTGESLRENFEQLAGPLHFVLPSLRASLSEEDGLTSGETKPEKITLVNFLNCILPKPLNFVTDLIFDL